MGLAPGNKPDPGTIPVLILAAGEGRRLGRAKQTLRWGDETLLERVIRQMRALTPAVWVVAGARYPLVRYRTRVSPAGWIYNPRWRRGLASSLQCGLEAMDVRAAGVLVVLADQPLIPARHYAALYHAARDGAQAALATDAGAGLQVPAYLPRALWPAVAELRGDTGARRLLRRVGARALPCPEAAIDVDRWADWQRLRQRAGHTE